MGLRRIETGDVTLAVTETGEGGRPLLLVHGFTGAKEDFTELVDPLAEDGWHVVAPDLRGHGASDGPPGQDAYDLDMFVADVVALADALGWERFALAGHSMGGAVAQRLAPLVAGNGQCRVGSPVQHPISGPAHASPPIAMMVVASTEANTVALRARLRRLLSCIVRAAVLLISISYPSCTSQDLRRE